MSPRRVRPAARRDPIDTELQAAMAESLALALRRAYDAWLRAILYPLTRGEIRGKPLRTPPIRRVVGEVWAEGDPFGGRCTRVCGAMVAT